MKQVEYTKEQEFVIELLKPFDELTYKNRYSCDVKDLRKVINDIKEKYNVKPKYLTLRQYLTKHSHGAYHDFIFKIDNVDVKVIGVDEFERYYNGKLLDKYFVIKDDYSDNGGDCCSFNGKHILTIERVEV